MTVAIVHEFLNQLGGAEKVLEVFHEIFPEAPVYVLAYDEKKTGGAFKDWNIKTSFIQRLPFGVKKHRLYFWLMPKAVESFDLSGYDVVLSNCSAYAKGAVAGPNAVSVCYCHTPTRYLWSDRDYVQKMAGGKIKAAILAPFMAYLRCWDKKAAGRVDEFIANSGFIAGRIRKYYGRESAVIYPPVDTENFYLSPENEIGNYFLLISRLQPYKKVDLAIAAFNQLGLPLKIIGQGESEEDLKKLAKPNVEFLGRVSDEKKAEYLSKCRALIHPQTEDFGLTPVEAMASGRPVIAFEEGGAPETMIDGVTGVFFAEQAPEALAEAVRNFRPENFNPEKIREHALKFGKERFKKEIREFIESAFERKIKSRNK